MKFDRTRLYVYIVTAVTLIATYFIAGKSFKFLLNCAIAALVVVVVLGLVRSFARSFRHHDPNRLRRLLVLSVAVAVGLTLVFTESSFADFLGHWLVGFTSLNGWFAIAVLVVGSYLAIFGRKPRSVTSSSHNSHGPRSSNADQSSVREGYVI